MLDSFQLHVVPSFCGGRILTGFYHCDKVPYEELVKELFTVLPPSTPNGHWGIIYAVTNSLQVKGAEFLTKLGFKPMAVTDKYGVNKTISPCTTWFGLWHEDVKPTLLKIQDEMNSNRINSVSQTGSLRKQFSTLPPNTVPVGTLMRITETRNSPVSDGTLYRVGHTFHVQGNTGDGFYLTNRIFNSVGNVFRSGPNLRVRVEDCRVA